MNKFFIILSFCYCQFYSIGQNRYDFYKYRKYCNSAEMASFEKKYKLEKECYEKAFKYMNPKAIVNLTYDEYINCLLNNKDTLAAINAEFQYLVPRFDFVNSDDILKKFGQKYGKDLIRKFPKIKKENDNYIQSTENLLAILELEKRDQAIRNDKNNMPVEVWNKLLIYIDSVNFYELYQLVKYKNESPACFLMYHIYGDNRKYFDFFDSVQKSKIYSGEGSPEAYVQWYDRQRMYVNNLATQLYGEWNNQGDGSVQFNPIEDIKNVDKRRFALGLCSLKDYSLLHNLPLPKDYTPPKK